MSKAQIDFSNFDFKHLQTDAAEEKAGVVCFLGENAVVVDAAGVAFSGKASPLNESDAGGLSEAIGKDCPNRPVISKDKIASMTAGAVVTDDDNKVTEIPPHGAALNLQNGNKFVIHAVGPNFQGKDANNEEDVNAFRNGLKETFKNIFSVWLGNEETKEKKLYLPFISGDINGGSTLGSQYYQIFIEELESAIVENNSVDFSKIHIVAYVNEEKKAVEDFFQEREKARVMELLHQSYSIYLAEQLDKLDKGNGDLLTRISNAKHLVIEQGRDGNTGTDPKALIEMVYGNGELKTATRNKQVFALRNHGNALTGHWDFLTPKLEGDKVVNYQSHAISGTGLACGAYTVMKILGQAVEEDAIEKVGKFPEAAFTAEEKEAIIRALNTGEDLSQDGGILARKFVAHIVGLQMTKDHASEDEIKKQRQDIMTRQIEQENLKRAFEYFDIAVVTKSALAQDDLLSFEKWVFNTHFHKEHGKYSTTTKEKQDELFDRGANADEKKALLVSLEIQFTEAVKKEDESNKLNEKKVGEIASFVSSMKEIQSSIDYEVFKTATNDKYGELDCIFPTEDFLKTIFKDRKDLPKDLLKNLAHDSEFTKKYFDSVKIYLKACGYDCDAEPAFVDSKALIKDNPQLFAQVVQSVIDLTAENKITLNAVTADLQNKLLKDLQAFAVATEQTKDKVGVEYKNSFEKLESIVGAILLPAPAPAPAPAAPPKPEKKIIISLNQEDEGYDDSKGKVFLENDKLYISAKDKKTEVEGVGVYYELAKEGDVNKAKFFTKAEADADATKKSWREDVMKYYRGEAADIPKSAVQAISVIALNANENSRSGGRNS